MVRTGLCINSIGTHKYVRSARDTLRHRPRKTNRVSVNLVNVEISLQLNARAYS